MNGHQNKPAASLETILEADRSAREKANQIVKTSAVTASLSN